MVSPVLLWIGVVPVALIIIILCVMLFSWNIPTIILRYQGNKQRPQVVPTKARKYYRKGVRGLRVRGYKVPLADFKSENYYPSKKGKHGALLLFEPKPGLLVPAVPRLRKLFLRGEDRERLRVLEEAQRELGLSSVDFEFDEDLYKRLLIRAVDDVDIDWGLQQVSRFEQQYTTGWRDWFTKNAATITIVFVMICLLTGFIVWIDKSPDLAAQCASWGTEQANNVLKSIAESGGLQSSSGVPPG